MSDSGIEITPDGYQGPAQHTWTVVCDGFHGPGRCPAREPVQEITFSGGAVLPLNLGALAGGH